MKLKGESVFVDGRVVKDEEVFRQVIKHAKLLDLLNLKKVVGIELECYTLLCSDPDSLKGNWKFEKKHGVWK